VSNHKQLTSNSEISHSSNSSYSKTQTQLTAIMIQSPSKSHVISSYDALSLSPPPGCKPFSVNNDAGVPVFLPKAQSIFGLGDDYNRSIPLRPTPIFVFKGRTIVTTIEQAKPNRRQKRKLVCSPSIFPLLPFSFETTDATKPDLDTSSSSSNVNQTSNDDVSRHQEANKMKGTSTKLSQFQRRGSSFTLNGRRSLIARGA
jgi:hypothetical protein